MLPEKEIALLIKEWGRSSRTPQTASERPETSFSENTIDTIAATRQEPIFHKLTTVGTADIDDNSGVVAFRPDARISADAGSIQNFLVPKILEAEKTKHGPAFDYKIETSPDGTVRAVLVRADLDEERLKKLLDAVGWTFAKAAEPAGK